MKKVIIVEDDMITKFFMVAALKRIGNFVIDSVANSKNLFNIIRENKPDVVLMDIGIEGSMDGIQASKILIQEHKIPVFFITGKFDHETLTKARSVGALDIIYKPINDTDLHRQLLDLFNRLPNKAQ